MGSVTVYSIPKMDALLNEGVVGASIVAGSLILQKRDGTTVNAGDVLADIPAASEFEPGIIQLASDVETIAGTDSSKAVTPFSLAAISADDTRKGLVELATTTETTTGTDATRAVTPAGVKAVADTKQPLDSDLTAIAVLTPANDDFVQRKSGVWVNRTLAQVGADLIATSSFAASSSQKGVVELATSAETATGTDSVRAVTPAGLASLLSKLPKAMASGDVSITPVANSPTFQSVTFPAGRFTQTPNIQLTARSTVPGSSVVEVSHSNASPTGCDIYIYRVNTIPTTVDWLATEF